MATLNETKRENENMQTIIDTRLEQRGDTNGYVFTHIPGAQNIMNFKVAETVTDTVGKVWNVYNVARIETFVARADLLQGLIDHEIDEVLTLLDVAEILLSEHKYWFKMMSKNVQPGDTVEIPLCRLADAPE